MVHSYNYLKFFKPRTAMKITIQPILLFTLLIFACSTEKQPEPVSGIEEYSVAGEYSLTIDATDVTATITLIGGGGGGGGGVEYDENVGVITLMSTGGGGGGGAGDSLLFREVQLEGNIVYTIRVGSGGAGGVIGEPGDDGGVSTFQAGTTVLYNATGGTGGSSNVVNNFMGGAGGNGYPPGTNGSNGTEVNGGTAKAGSGGDGGDNLSGYGAGGTGGKGSGFSGGNAIDASPGDMGGDGYVRIEWRGLR